MAVDVCQTTGQLSFMYSCGQADNPVTAGKPSLSRWQNARCSGNPSSIAPVPVGCAASNGAAAGALVVPSLGAWPAADYSGPRVTVCTGYDKEVLAAASGAAGRAVAGLAVAAVAAAAAAALNVNL